MKTTKKFGFYSVVMGAALAATSLLAPSANAESILANIRVLLPNGQYLSVGDTPDNRWYNRPEYRQYGFNRYHYDSARRAYVAYDGQGNHYGHNHGWQAPQQNGNWHNNQGGDNHDHNGDDHGGNDWHH